MVASNLCRNDDTAGWIPAPAYAGVTFLRGNVKLVGLFKNEPMRVGVDFYGIAVGEFAG